MCNLICWPWHLISSPLERVIAERYIPVIRCSAKLSFGASLVAGGAGGFTAGLAVYNAVCTGNGCTGLSDAKSYLSDSIPWVGAAIGVVALPAIVCAAAQGIGCVMAKRQVVHMEPLPAAADDARAPLLSNSAEV